VLVLGMIKVRGELVDGSTANGWHGGENPENYGVGESTRELCIVVCL
jgi:hypothetical protein